MQSVCPGGPPLPASPYVGSCQLPLVLWGSFLPLVRAVQALGIDLIFCPGWVAKPSLVLGANWPPLFWGRLWLKWKEPTDVVLLGRHGGILFVRSKQKEVHIGSVKHVFFLRFVIY